MRLPLIVLAGSLGTMGCIAHPQSPAPPERIVLAEAIAVVPAEEASANSGRVILDVVEDHATVYEVTALTEVKARPTVNWVGRTAYPQGPLLRRKLQPLCVTPCAVDLEQGGHSLVFHSATDETRTSSADITVAATTTAVRHALGRETGATGSYLGGLLLMIPAVGLTMVGGIATVAGVAARDSASVDANGQTTNRDSRGVLTVGLVLLGVGAALGITSGFLMANHRPVKQSGSTTQWVLVP